MISFWNFFDTGRYQLFSLRSLHYHHTNLLVGAQNGWDKMSNVQRLNLMLKVIGVVLALGFLSSKAGVKKGLSNLLILPAAYFTGLKLASNFLHELMSKQRYQTKRVNLESVISPKDEKISLSFDIN